MKAKGAHGRGLWLIAAFKLMKAAAFIAIGVGALRLLHKDVAGEVEHWVNMFRVDPHNHFINWLLTKLEIVDDRRLKELSAGTFAYAGIFLVEGTGLELRKRWAEYFTSIVTGSFIPLEIYELIHHFSVGKLTVVAINGAVVFYLVSRLKRCPSSSSFQSRSEG